MLPSHPEEHIRRRSSAGRSRRASQQYGRSRDRSGSRSRSSEHSASADGDSEDEDSSDPRYQWRPIVEDKSEPCDDESTYIDSRAATEHSALDHAYWEEQTFFELNDEQITPLESGRIDWLVERFNGTKDEPNSERIMRSPIVHIGGYDWHIVFHFEGDLTGFLRLIMQLVPSASTIYELRTILWKLYSRTKSRFYGRNHDGAAITGAVAYSKSVAHALDQESDKVELVQLLGSLDPEKGALVVTNKLQTKNCSSVQEAINKDTGLIKTPVPLPVELRRHDFDRDLRKWKKFTDRVSVEDFLTVSDGSTSCPKVYQLYAVVTHISDLQSKKHNVYVRPVPSGSGGSGLWRSWTMGALIRRLATRTRDETLLSVASMAYDSADNKVIYLALYTDSGPKHPLPKEEPWAVPEDIRKGLQFSKQKEKPKPPPSADAPADMPFRVELIKFEQQLRAREIEETGAGGPSVAEWPLTDEEGETFMSDTEDGPLFHY
ncbi:hypothetical protein LTR56_026485 [Elasticomyces elasticus]|nr:hypothetical protein LTR56_026485 [Elasticomyces elasticus]KAK3617478.1 hypothetical protein LTR22_026720 [Elasticomyces elasticus]KAK4902428.1 hypothetical protein LTR49_027051 [Elasticomyces elasticus]